MFHRVYIYIRLSLVNLRQPQPHSSRCIECKKEFLSVKKSLEPTQTEGKAGIGLFSFSLKNLSNYMQ